MIGEMSHRYIQMYVIGEKFVPGETPVLPRMEGI
jgi:hypothetical protein